jgi:argininosuccinate lyase
LEFSYVRFGDGFVQSSSIMPQKRNPVAIEHARAISSKALGQAQAIIGTVHNTPFGDIVDTEDDLQPLVSSMFRDAVRAFGLVAAAIQTAEFDPVKLEARAGEGGTTSTELADTLAREQGLPFKTAHGIAVRVLKARHENPHADLSSVLAAVCLQTIGRRLPYTDQDLQRILSARYFVEVRRTLGGPAPEETARALGVSEALLDEDHAWLTGRRAALAAADRRRHDRAAAL